MTCSPLIILSHLKGKAAPETKVSTTWTALTALLIPREMEARLALSQQDTITGQGCQWTRCKLLHHIFKASAVHMPPFDKVTLNPAQPSACLISNKNPQYYSHNSLKAVFQPTVAVAAIVAAAPPRTVGTRFDHLSNSIVLSKAESH